MIRDKLLSARESLSGLEGRFARWQITVLASMYVGYAAFMVCRNTLIASSAQMMEDPALGMDKESFGHLMSWHSAGAIMGKLVTGPGADWLGGRRMFLIALSLTAMANVGFAFSSTFIAFAAFNFFGQFAKSGGWPAMTKMVSSWYEESRYGQVWSIISTSSRVGTILAGLVLGYLLSLIDWRGVFVFSAVSTFGVVALLWFYMKDHPQDVGLSSLKVHCDSKRLAATSVSSTEGTVASDTPHPFDSLTLWQVCGQFVRSGRFWSIGFSIVFLTIVMDFLTFIPIYLSESLNISASKASMAGSAFPAGMFTALVLTSFFYDRLSKRQLVIVLGGLLATSSICVLALWNLDMIATSLRTPAAIATIFLLGLTISPAYYVPMSVFSVSFGGKHSGFLVSLIDVFGYSGALLFNFFGGSIAEHYGWSVFLSGLLTITVSATVCMVTFLSLDRKCEKIQLDVVPRSDRR
ncbi:MAG: MFS transporter [Planctomycetales bacterium]|nr:MFS transporter [Planctomycetales bacterium]